MDFIGITLVLTFLGMIGTGAIAMSSQSPPPYRRVVTCPEDDGEARAIVSLSWNRTERRTAVVKCDNCHWKEGSCEKSCEPFVQGLLPEAIPTTVVP
jgi:hypothetical protein